MKCCFMQHFIWSSLFAKEPVKGFPVYKGITSSLEPDEVILNMLSQENLHCHLLLMKQKTIGSLSGCDFEITCTSSDSLRCLMI